MSPKFKFTEHETALIMDCTLTYKNAKLAKGKDRETQGSRFALITDLLQTSYPSDDDVRFPHDQVEFSKERVKEKIKSIKKTTSEL